MLFRWCFSCIILFLCVSGTTHDALIGLIEDTESIAYCQDYQNNSAVTGFSTDIGCSNFGRRQEAPFWFINNIVYELFSIPQYFSSIPVVTSYTSLDIPNVTMDLNNVTFRCAVFLNNGSLKFGSNCIQLTVTNGSNSGKVSPGLVNVLSVNYQKLHVRRNSATFGWTLRNRVNCSGPIKLQGHIIINNVARVSPANVISVNNEMNFGEIIIPELSTSGNPLYYRLAAFDENGTICSDVMSQNTYYRLDGTRPLTSKLSPNSSSICFNITTDCTRGLYFIWPQRQKGYSCLCPVYNSHDGRLVFSACVQGCKSDFTLELSEDDQVCLYGFNSSMNGTLFHFMCSINPCTHNCFIKNILSSHMVVFSGQQGAVTGFSTSVPCDHGRQEEAPFWFINNTVYELFSIPQYFPFIPVVTSYTSLNIPNVTRRVDNTVFRCATFDRNGELTSPDNAIRLIVSNGTNPGSISQPSNILTIDYQQLHMQENITLLGWNYININCFGSIEIQGHTIVNDQAVISPNVTRVDNSVIHSTQLFTSDQLYYRLVALDENGTICSDATSQKTYYGFEGSRQITMFSPVTLATCFNTITEIGACPTSLYFIWPQRLEGLSCLCPVYDSEDGRSVFESCTQGCESDFMPHLAEDGQVCLTDLSESMNGTSFHFMCSTDPCTDNCFIKTIISSHMLIFSEYIVLNADTMAELSCNLQNGRELPFWFLNDTLYTLTTLQQIIPSFSSVNNTLTIFGLPPSFSDTNFQCGLFVSDSLVRGNLIYSLIVSEPVNQQSYSILLNYQELEITSVRIQIRWIPQQICAKYYVVQQFYLNGTLVAEMRETLPHATIPVHEDTNTSLFRIIAVDENDTICSDDNSLRRHFMFAATEYQTEYPKPNHEVCLPVPAEQLCNNVEVIWLETCSIPVKAIGTTDIYCARNSTQPQYNRNTSMVCFVNEIEGFVHFQCSEQNPNSELQIYTILSSHLIVRAEEPVITFSNDCFNVNSSIEVFIDYTISSSGMSNTNASSAGLLCFNDTFPGDCRNFTVTVSATNAVGNTQKTQNFTSSGCKVLPPGESSNHSYIVEVIFGGLVGLTVLVVLAVIVVAVCVAVYKRKHTTYTI